MSRDGRRARLVSVHLYSGLVLALPLLVIAASGTLLGLSRIGCTRPGGLPIEGLEEQARTRFPDATIARIDLPECEGKPARVRFTDGRMARLDASTGAILNVATSDGSDPLTLLYRIHRGKVLGLTGQLIASLAGMSVFLLWMVGLAVRRRSRTASAYPLRAHMLLGAPLGFALACVALGGAALNFSSQLIARLDPVPPATTHGAAGGIAFARLAETARTAYARAPIVNVTFAGSAPVQFYFADSSRVYLDAASGQLLKVASWSSHWTRSLFELHSGRLLGSAQPFWNITVGSAMLALIVSGLLLARTRLGSRGSAR